VVNLFLVELQAQTLQPQAAGFFYEYMPAFIQLIIVTFIVN